MIVKHWTEAGRRNTNIFLYLLVFSGTAVRLVNALQKNPMDALFSDPLRYWEYATDGLFSLPMAAVDPIGYQIWLGGVAKLTLGDPLAVGIYAGLLSAATPWIWYRFARELLSNKQLALLVFAVLALLPSWIAIFSYFMNETLLLPLLGAALWLTWRALRLGTTSAMCLAVVVWMFACMTRIVALPAAIVSIVAMISAFPPRLFRGMAALAIALALAVPVAYRTYQIIRVPSPFGYSAFNQIYWESGARSIDVHLSKDGGRYLVNYHFESPSMFEDVLSPLLHWHSRRSGTVEVWVDLDRGTADWNREMLRHWPALKDTIRLWSENLIFLGFGRSWPDSNPYVPIGRIQAGMRWIWVPLLIFVCCLNGIYLYRYRAMPLIVLITVGLWAVCLFAPSAVIEGRYRKPLEGLTIINAIWFFDKTRLFLPRKNLAEQNEPASPK